MRNFRSPATVAVVMGCLICAIYIAAVISTAVSVNTAVNDDVGYDDDDVRNVGHILIAITSVVCGVYMLCFICSLIGIKKRKAGLMIPAMVWVIIMLISNGFTTVTSVMHGYWLQFGASITSFILQIVYLMSIIQLRRIYLGRDCNNHNHQPQAAQYSAAPGTTIILNQPPPPPNNMIFQTPPNYPAPQYQQPIYIPPPQQQLQQQQYQQPIYIPPQQQQQQQQQYQSPNVSTKY